MKNGALYAEINMAKVPADANIGGLIFAAATVMIFFWGIPLVRVLFPAAIVVGGGIALALHFLRPDATGKPWIPPGLRKN
jgi:hypothetical protein